MIGAIYKEPLVNELFYHYDARSSLFTVHNMVSEKYGETTFSRFYTVSLYTDIFQEHFDV